MVGLLATTSLGSPLLLFRPLMAGVKMIENTAARAGEAASQAVAIAGKTSTAVRTVGWHLSKVAPVFKKAASGVAQGGGQCMEQ